MNSKKSRLSRIRNWNNKRRQKNAEKKKIIAEIKAKRASAKTTEEPTPTIEEPKEPTQEPLPKTTEEPTPTIEEPKEPTQEPLPKTTEEPTPTIEEPKEPTQKFSKFSFRGMRKKKPNKKKKTVIKRDPEWMRIFTLVITLTAMLLGLSIMPLFPQPLPVVIAFLIAFVTLKKPILGIPIGGLLVGLGLMYNLAKLNFIVMLGEPTIRWTFVFVFLFLFTGLPIIFRDRKSAIVINLGIIAAISLFSNQAFFLAIPILVSSTVIFKKISILSVVYYVLLSVPMQIMQYLKHVIQIPRVDWWVETGSSPPIYVPLTQIFADVQESMLQFRLYDTSKVVYAISEQLSIDPPVMEHTVMEMLSHYIDSLPGIILLLIMVIGIISAVILFIRTGFSQTNLGEVEKILPIIMGITTTILFYVLANSLQDPLAFRVDLTSSAMVLGTLGAALFTLPTFFIDFAPKEKATVDMIQNKCNALLDKILGFENNLLVAKNALPISFSSLENKSLIYRDKVEDINSKNLRSLIIPSEINKVLEELETTEKAIDNLDVELEDQLMEYHIFAICELSKWRGQFKNIGITLKNNKIINFKRGLLLSNRVEDIKEIIDISRENTEEIIDITQKIYSGIRSLFDPNLSKQSQSIIFARKKLNEKVEPWNILETLYISLINMKKNYKTEISNSIENIKTSLITINKFKEKNEKLSIALGNDYSKIIDLAEKANEFRVNFDKENFVILDIIKIEQVFDSIIRIAEEFLMILIESLKAKEKNIESLIPPEGYMWGKNLEIIELMNSTIVLLKGRGKRQPSKILEKLPSILNIANKGKKVIISYKEKEELLLNYPVAEIVLEEQLKKKKKVTAKDLPFDPKYSIEYLKLFHSKRYNESNYDEINNILSNKK